MPTPPPVTNVVGPTLFDYIFLLMIPAAFAITVVVFMILWFVWLPTDAKRLFWLKRSKRGVAVFVCGDEGRMQLRVGEPRAQGVLYLGKNAQKKRQYSFLPRKRAVNYGMNPETQERLQAEWAAIQNIPDPTEKMNAIQAYDAKEASVKNGVIDFNREIQEAQDMVAKRYFLEGIQRPVYLAYAGKTIAASPSAIATLNLPNPTGTKGLWHGHFKKETDAEILVEPMLLIDPRVLKTAFPAMYTDSQVGVVQQAAYDIGREEAGSQISKLMIPIVAVVIVMVVAVILLKMI